MSHLFKRISFSIGSIANLGYEANAVTSNHGHSKMTVSDQSYKILIK